MTKKLAVLATTIAMSLVLADVAKASTVVFDPTGTAGSSGDITIDRFDWQPGNTLAISPVPFPVVTAGTVVTFLYQANLGTADCVSVGCAPSGAIFTNGQGGNFFTVAAAKGEQVTFASGTGFDTFGPTAAGPNVFNIYRHSVIGNDLTGDCFVTDCTGTLILSGTFDNDPATFFWELCRKPGKS